ncbi:efflux RND transporter permease subunit [Blastopirellula marina]|uniref:SSD domain-containing protein n=1 Tax=Blastopirellula marina TaxID=124 RepID=A0A2S8GR06_9BACT|nr:MMPL family transporter [Blastopirellula marina]PQO46832.1 hypothetical protein C5Y93_06695 [Blastopirellula marina]
MNARSWRNVGGLGWVLWVALLLIPLISFGASQAMRSNANSPIDWAPASFPLKGEYDNFVARFGPGDAVIASWEGCTLDNPQLDELATALRNDPCFHDSQGQSYFYRVVNGREALQRLTQGVLPVPREEALKTLQGVLLGPDGKTTCVVTFFTEEGRSDRAAITAAMEAKIEAICDVPPEQLHLAGPIIDGLRVDQAGKSALDRLAVPSALVVLLAACLILRDWRLGLLVFGISVYCQGATLALVYLCGETMSVLLIVLPPLIQVLAVAGGIHLVNYYRESIPHVGREAAPRQAIRLGWFPCLLSAATTAIGIGSLAATRLIPIRLFGIFGAMGVSLTAGLLLTLFPALLMLFGKKRAPQESWSVPISRARTSPLWDRLAGGLQQRSTLVITTFLVALVSAGLGVIYLKSSVRIETLFPPHSRIVTDSQWLESQLGPLVTIDVVVSVPEETKSGQGNLPIAIVQEIDAALRVVPEVQSTFSALQMVPADVFSEKVPDALREAGLRQFAPLLRREAISIGRLASGEGRDYWRISANISSTDAIDYGDLLQTIRAKIDPLVAQQTADVQVQYSGIMPLVHDIQRALMTDLFISFGQALVLIAGVLVIALKGIRAGLLAMLPNLFPVLLMFGILGWLGVPLDIGTVMTASIAMGVAVDDTLHFLVFYRRGLAQGELRGDAVRHALQHCAPAMIQTSVICILGMSVFCLSDFVPTVRFAWMMAAMLGAALVGDLLFLPALILSRWGECFGHTQEVTPWGERPSAKAA